MRRGNLTDIPEGGCLRIKNAAKRINRTIYLVGSRSNGSFKFDSDFDYVITGIKSREWTKIKNSLPGSKNHLENLQSRIDLFKGDIDLRLPYFAITANELENECR
jgi:hypothetical protein